MPAMSWKGVQFCKIGRIIFRAVTYLLITTLGVSYSSAHAQTLTPDLIFSTYLGGAAGSNPLTFGQNAACDALGNIYVTGATQVSDLPVPNAYQPTPAPGSTESAFVAKYNEAGQLLWCTYLGGNNQSMGIGVAAMPNGGVVVVGITTSNGSGSFPTLNGFQSQNNGQSDYFVSVFNAQGKLQYSTYLGGSGVEGGVTVTPGGQIIFNDNSNNGNCVAVDANGRVYVGGLTTSSNLPVTANALQSNLAGTTNACLFILDPSKIGAASLVYSSFLGGNHDTQGHSVAVDPSGRYISVAGFTTSSTFPTTPNAYRSTAPPGGFAPNSSNGFVTEFQSSQPGSPSSQYTMRYSTYLGANSSTARDDVYGMTMEPTGLIVATGRTESAGFPMTNGGPTIFNKAPYLQEGVSGDEPFLVKINPSLNGTASLVYSTFLGGGSASKLWGSFSTSVAVDARGAVYVAGETTATTPGAPYVPSNLTAPQTFPYTPNAFLQAPPGSEDATLMQINPSGDYLGYSTYLGGTNSDRTYGLAVDPDGNVVMSGLTFSNNFPLQNPAQTYPGNDGYQNAFVTEFSPLYTPNNLIIDNGATYTVAGNITYDNEYIGQNSTGTLIQGGFTNTVNNNLELGQNAGASGSYTLSDPGSGSLLSVAGNEYIGYSGTGTFTQSGGTNTVTGILILAANAGSSGTYSLSGGSLTVGDYEAVGYFGTGSFTQSGGTHTVTALYLGTDAGASGSYTLSDSGSGSLLSVVGNEYIGNSGTGTFNQSGGSHTVARNLSLGNYDGGIGTYTLSGGGLAVSGSEYVGYAGTGSFTQSGGTNTVDNELALGVFTGSSGTYTLSGGSLSASYESIAVEGSGTFIQSGGSNTVADLLDFGHSSDIELSGGTSAYTLSGGSLSVSGGEFIGDSGSGTFNQSGGSHTVSDLEVGSWEYGNSPGTGSYTLSGGSLSVADEFIGQYGGSGTFTQSGGVHTVDDGSGNGYLGVGSHLGTGSYTLSGGSLQVNGYEAIGNLGSGAFTQTGGTHTVVGELDLGFNSGGSGTYNLSAGSLAVSGNEYVGYNNGSGAFTQTGGTNTVTGALNLANSSGTSGSYLLSGGSLVAGTVNLNTGGSFTMTGGTLTATTFNGNLANGGSVKPGDAPGIMTVNGNYSQTASGTLVEQIASASNYASLLVGGTASLNGTLAPVLLGGYIPAVNQVFPGVITASGGVTGAFSSVANSTPILGWQVIDPAGTVDLLSKRNYAGTGLELTRNQFNLGAMLNGIQGAATGDLAYVLNTIAALPSNAAVANAYQQISPDKVAALSSLAFAGANLQKSTLSRRITDLRFGPGDAGLTAGGLGSFSLNYAQGEGLMVASSASSLSGLLSGQKDPNALEQPWGVYFDPGLILGGQGSTLDQTGFDFTMAGFTAGVDYRVWQDLLLGLNTGYTYTSAGFRGSGGYVHGNTWPLNAYAAYLPKPFYAYGSLGYALNLYSLERDFNFGGLTRAANSSSTGNQLNAYGETGYDFKVNPVVLTPALTLSYSHLWLDGFTETGAGALDLTVGSQNAQSLQTGVGGKIAVPLQRDGVTVTPQIYGFYQHEYSDGSRTLDARLSQADNGFNFVTGAAHRNFAVLGADVTIASRKNLKVQLDYNAEVGRGNYTAHYISAGLRWQF